MTRRELQDDLRLIVDHQSREHFVPADAVDSFRRMHPDVMVQGWVCMHVAGGRTTLRIDIFEPTYVRSIEVSL